MLCAMPACAERCSLRSRPVFCAGPSSYFVRYWSRTYGMAAPHSSVLRSAPSVLAVCSAALRLLGIDPTRDRRNICVTAAALYGALLIAIALNPWAGALPGLFVVAGVTMSLTNTSANTFVQSAAAANLRGQAVSLYMLASRGGTALGGLATGLSVEMFGVRNALFINGALAVIAQLLIGRMWRRQAGIASH